MKNIKKEIVKHFVQNDGQISTHTVLGNEGQLYDLQYDEIDKCSKEFFGKK